MRFDKLDLNLLVALDVLLETRSVSESARRLNLSQPSVSAALARLRDYFGDELLVKVGRTMTPTPRGQVLASRVRQALTLIRAGVTGPEEFDPANSDRAFVVVASDYVYDVLLADVIRTAARLAPRVSFDVVPPAQRSVASFEHGDVDLLVTVSRRTLRDHPSLPILEDVGAVICCAKGRHRDGLDEAAFLAADHVVAGFGNQQLPPSVDDSLADIGAARRVALRVGSYSALPRSVIGTDRIATMHLRHARLFAELHPIRVHPLPIESSIVRQIVQWPRVREHDEGVRWLLRLIREAASAQAASE